MDEMRNESYKKRAFLRKKVLQSRFGLLGSIERYLARKKNLFQTQKNLNFGALRSRTLVAKKNLIKFFFVEKD